MSDLTSTSVIIPAFNVRDCLRRAIYSALEQTLPPLEVIVVDDGSTDDTADLVRKISREEPKVKLKLMPGNRGPSAARNAGIADANGEWIALLDADDYYHPARLDTIVEFASQQNLTMVADNFYLYDPVLQRVSKIAVDPGLIGERLDLNVHDFVSRCRGSRPAAVDFGLLKPVIRRGFIESKGLRYDESCHHGEDFLFYFSALQAGASFTVLPAAYYFYTERVGSLSRKFSALSRTTNRHDAMQAQARELAANVTDPQLAELLLRRAEAIARFPKMAEFHRKSVIGKLLSVRDPHLRQHVYEAIRYQMNPKRWRKQPC